MSFDIFFSAAFILCLIGLIIRFSFWFSRTIDPSLCTIHWTRRLLSAFKGLIAVVFSSKILSILQSLFVDLLFQKRIFDKSLLRWVTHACIFFGFVLLFFTHAIGFFTFELFDYEYISTLNPSLLIRNIFGTICLLGVCLAIFRRLRSKKIRLKNAVSDWTALALVGLILVSGFLLEAAKMSSQSVYLEMVDEYGDYEDEEAEALEAYWITENGLYSPNFSGSLDEDTIALGMELNEDGSCIECHASNRNAFISRSLTGIVGPITHLIGDARSVIALRVLHLGLCLALLVWLPFSKMFHIISAPISLIITRVMKGEINDPVNGLNRQLIGLSACTHCGACTIECSSSMFYESFQNDFILPSEKVQHLKKIASGRKLPPQTLKSLQQGLYICTSCDRCTDICPSGINLRSIFLSSRYYLLEKNLTETSLLGNFSFPLALAGQYAETHLKALKNVYHLFRQQFPSLKSLTEPLSFSASTTIDTMSSTSCYSCQRCTNICPVVNSYDQPLHSLGLLPHQIIHSLGCGQLELAAGSQMIWSCTSCYLCQEHCPNNVELTDIFYRLKNLAINRIEAGETV